MTAPLPVGFRVETDPDTTVLPPHALMGGRPRRLMRLTVAGQAAWDELSTGAVQSAAAAVLARRLTDAGLMHPRPAQRPTQVDVTVLVPVKDHPDHLDRCLRAIGGRYPVVVVDDGSEDPGAIARVAARHGSTLVVRATNGGPGAARNTGLSTIDSELVALLDSDCEPSDDWIAPLAAHFADPLVAAVAPRIVSGANAPLSYTDTFGLLDLGDRPSRVRVGERVSYVPTAALLVRRAALAALDDFDESLRYGEDVDLVWRLDDAGWRVRYDPAVAVRHLDTPGWLPRLGRRFSYGTSAAALSRRHDGALAPFAASPWALAAVVGLLGRRPVLAASGAVGVGWLARRTVRRDELDGLSWPSLAATQLAATSLAVGRYATQFAAPALAAAIVSRPSSRRGRRLAALALAVGPAVVDYARERSAVGPARFVAGRLADDLAYGSGVYTGCLRERTVAPLLPKIQFPSKQRSSAVKQRKSA